MGQSRISSPMESKYTSIVGALVEASGLAYACVEVKTQDVAEPLV